MASTAAACPHSAHILDAKTHIAWHFYETCTIIITGLNSLTCRYVVILKFDTLANMNAWLGSEDRKTLLAESAQFTVREHPVAHLFVT